MMERRNFLGSMLAIFCGVALPEPPLYGTISHIRVFPMVVQPVRLMGDPEVFAETFMTNLALGEKLKKIYLLRIVENIKMGSTVMPPLTARGASMLSNEAESIISTLGHRYAQ